MDFRRSLWREEPSPAATAFPDQSFEDAPTKAASSACSSSADNVTSTD